MLIRSMHEYDSYKHHKASTWRDALELIGEFRNVLIFQTIQLLGWITKMLLMIWERMFWPRTIEMEVGISFLMQVIDEKWGAINLWSISIDVAARKIMF